MCDPEPPAPRLDIETSENSYGVRAFLTVNSARYELSREALDRLVSRMQRVLSKMPEPVSNKGWRD